MKIVFVTRKFPPSVGGLETAASELYTSLAKKHEVRLVKWGGSNTYLPLVYPYLLVKALCAAVFIKPDVVYLQDGMLSPIAFAIKVLTKCPVVLSVHGLDITYTPKLYQAILRWAVPKSTVVVAGSEWTLQEAVNRFPNTTIKKITYGVRDVFYSKEDRGQLLKKVSSIIGEKNDMSKTKIIVTTGRLVERKGVAWFLESVYPSIITQQPQVLYLVAGDGPDRQKIESVIEKHKLTLHVKLLGFVTPETRNLLYNACDIFLMPNIPVSGDGEGFGLVAVEAASCGATVIASQLEGLQDAVIDTKTGFLIRPKDVEQYTRVLEEQLLRPTLRQNSVRRAALDTYSWDTIADQYGALFATLEDNRGKKQ